MKYFILVIFLIQFFPGCKPQSGFKIQQDINISYNIDVNYSIRFVKRELGENYINSYLTKDRRNLFVYTINTNKENGQVLYSLLNYNLVGKTPKLENYIVDHSYYQIDDIHLLAKNKIIFSFATIIDEEFEKIVISDYKKGKIIRSYLIEFIYDDYEEFDKLPKRYKFSFSKNEKILKIGDHILDISDIYQEVSEPSQLYRDDLQKVVIDPVNNLVWQDDENVINQFYTIEDAVRICQAKAGYKWRLPTHREIGLLLNQQKIFTVPFVNFLKEYSYWLKPDFSHKNTSWVFSPFDSEFSFLDNKSDADHYSKMKRLVRCVADGK